MHSKIEKTNTSEAIKTMEKELTIIFLAYENMLVTSLSLPMELLLSAANIAGTSRSSNMPKLTIKTCSLDGKPKPSHTGIHINVDHSVDDIAYPTLIFLPALWRNPFPTVKKNQGICDWLNNAVKHGSIIAGVGTGCCFMAEAGLLDNKVATTHWYFFERFKQRYPYVKLQTKYFITRAENLYCTGSVNALGDLTIHFISQFFSTIISSEVERHYFHDVRHGYAKLALLDNHSQPHPDETILEVQSDLKVSIMNDVDLNVLAKKYDMSRRNLDRRFKTATGKTPLGYLQQIRMETAKDLLKQSNLPITEIMFHCGYQDATHFCNLFKKHHGATPRQYRKTVRAKLFNIAT